MTDQRDRRSIAFVVSSLAIGGPQKSLIGLLQRLNPDHFDITLIVLNSAANALSAVVPSTVVLAPPPPVFTAATLPRGRMVWATATLIRHLLTAGRALLAVRLVALLVWSAVTRVPGQQVRQRTWELLNGALPKLPGKFDLGIGILGLSTYVVVDSLDARVKYHWVRSDTRILARDERIEAKYFSRLDGSLSVSPSCAEIFETTYPFMRDRTIVYKNDIPDLSTKTAAEWPSISNDSLKLLTVARLDPLKGLDLALEAAAKLRSNGLQFSWLILGDGPERDSMQGLIDSEGLGDDFVLYGSVLDTADFLKQADIFVHPSRAEGRSNAVEEARAIGLPILATNYPTVADQVRSGVDGLVCEMSGEAIAEAIEHLARHHAESESYGATARSAYLSERDDPNRLFDQLSRERSIAEPFA